ncbi:MAG: hypothetical protein ACRYFR_03180 [Janthinobacterium lividum]
MGRLYDLVFAEFLQVWLHRAHLVDVWAADGEVRVLDFFGQLLAETGQWAGQHLGAPALLAALWALALRRAAGEQFTPAALQQEMIGALDTALRQSTVPAVPRAPTPAGAPLVGPGTLAHG